MVDVIAVVLGGLLVLTMFWAVTITFMYATAKPPTPGEPVTPNAFAVFMKTWFGLSPYIFFLAGPVIDAINSTFMYSKASIVGAITVLLTAIFGSDKFASTASNLVSMFPKIYTPFEGTPPPDFSKWSQFSVIGLLSWVGIGIVVFAPMIVGSQFGGLPMWGWVSTVGLAALLVLTILGGNNFLGSVTGEAFPPRRPVSGWSLNLGRTDVCTTPGLNAVQTRLAPAGILLTTSILSSHIFESLDTGNTKNTIASGVTALISFVIELAIFYTSGCSTDYRYGNAAPFISLLLGTGAGFTAYQAMKRVGQESFTSSDQSGGIFHPPPPVEKATKSDTEKLSTKIVVGPQPDTSAPVDDQDAFVCEAYKDGELITSTIVE